MDSYYRDKYGFDDFSEPKKREPARSSNSSRRNNRSKRSKKSKNKKNKRSLTILTVAVVVVLVAIVGVSLYVHHNRQFKFAKDVTVSGVNISGLTYDEAYETLENSAMNIVDDYEITVNVKDTTKTYTKSNFKYIFDYKTALEQAKEYTDIVRGEKEGEVTTSAFELPYIIDKQSVTDLVTNLAKEVDKDAVNAEVKEFKPFAEQRFIYKKEQIGFMLVQADLEAQINEVLSTDEKSATIDALGNEFEPAVTVEFLKENIVGLSTATSVSYNTANGNNNMKVALEACNGSVIEAGELWSFNECTGDSNLEENGYKSATVISGQQLTQGIGGGLCQASTTIFRAAIMANMSIYQRHNHFWASSYAYPGEDATIDYPNLDLKLRNPTDYQMFMECKMEGNVLTVNIYGYQDPSYDNIMIYSKNHDVKKKESYKTTTYRVLYLDGEIVKEETLCNSTYSLTDDVKIKDSDSGSFRTMVNGTHKVETNLPETEAETTEETTKKKNKKKKKKNTESTQETELETDVDSFVENTHQPTTEATE